MLDHFSQLVDSNRLCTHFHAIESPEPVQSNRFYQNETDVYDQWATKREGNP